jgi:hypothetical protein
MYSVKTEMWNVQSLYIGVATQLGSYNNNRNTCGKSYENHCIVLNCQNDMYRMMIESNRKKEDNVIKADICTKQASYCITKSIKRQISVAMKCLSPCIIYCQIFALEINDDINLSTFLKRRKQLT